MADWEQIKLEYITTEISYRKLSQKYGVDVNTLNRRGRDGGWVALRKQYTNKVTAKTMEKMSTKKANQRARVNDLADKLMDKLEKAIDELDLKTITVKEKVTDGNEETTKEYQKTQQGGVVSRTGLRQLTAALKDLKEVKDVMSELDKKEQEARIAMLKQKAEKEDGQQIGAVNFVFEGGGGIEDYGG